MAVYQEFKNLDDYYAETTGDKILLNEVRYFSLEERERINKALVTVYDNDSISMVPSCDCGLLRGGYLLGKLCTECSTSVRDVQEKTDPLLWLKAVDGMPKFMNPHYWLMVRTVMGKKIDCLRWLSDTSYNPPVEVPDFLIGIKNTFKDFERSYPYLLTHFESILVYLQNQATFKTARKKLLLEGLVDIYRTQHAVLFSTFLPIINKKLFIIENTSMGKFTNLGISDVIDTTLQFIKTCNDPKPTANKNSNIMARALSDLASIYAYYDKTYLSSKGGIFRKHVYGSRGHFTFRAVITSISGPHKYDEVHVPWSIGVTAFRPHLLNLLLKEGLSYKKASALLFYAVNNYDAIVDKVLNILINESRDGKLAIVLQRNPSLHQGSAQRLYISKFKTNPNDYTLDISILITKAMNADYDGDELNVIILGDNNMTDLAHTLDPAYSVPGRGKVAEVSKLLSIPGPTIATITNFLHHKSETNKPNDLIRKMSKISVDVR